MNQQPALIIMAGGIGSRYGGLKQVDPLGPNGEIIIDYSIYDALRAGFGKIIFLIRKEIEEIFHEKIGRSVDQRVETEYVLQDLHNLPAGFSVPEGRVKPWGTGHAVLCCKDAVDRPFAVINSDDFYGPGAFQVLADYLRKACDPGGAPVSGPYDYSMVGYVLRNALSEHGSVARGVCSINPDGTLASVHERTRIQKFGDTVKYSENGTDWVEIPADSIVSMNTWGFTPSIFAELEARFPVFLERSAANLVKAEFFLPDVVNELLIERRAKVKVLPTDEKWFGVTYPQDRPIVQQMIQERIAQGIYPERLWG
jgi:NDP-sugar pyrophosphorylase family protein